MTGDALNTPASASLIVDYQSAGQGELLLRIPAKPVLRTPKGVAHDQQ